MEGEAHDQLINFYTVSSKLINYNYIRQTEAIYDRLHLLNH